jgi:hypothetical protein
MLAVDPFEERYGFSAETASEMFSGLPEMLQPQSAEELIEVLDKANVTSEQGAREVRDRLLQWHEGHEKERAREERLAALESRFTEMPGSPLDSRLSNIEKMLTERVAREEEAQYAEQETARITDAHTAALISLVELGRARGIEPPDPADVEQFYQRTGAMRLEPNYAAKLAWSELVGPELFGPAKSTKLPYHATRNPRGSIIIPGHAAPTAARPATINDLIQSGGE